MGKSRLHESCFLGKGLGTSTLSLLSQMFSGKCGTHCQVEEAVCRAGLCKEEQESDAPDLGAPPQRSSFLPRLNGSADREHWKRGKRAPGLVGMMEII